MAEDEKPKLGQELGKLGEVLSEARVERPSDLDERTTQEQKLYDRGELGLGGVGKVASGSRAGEVGGGPSQAGGQATVRDPETSAGAPEPGRLAPGSAESGPASRLAGDASATATTATASIPSNKSPPVVDDGALETGGDVSRGGVPLPALGPEGDALPSLEAQKRALEASAEEVVGRAASAAAEGGGGPSSRAPGAAAESSAAAAAGTPTASSAGSATGRSGAGSVSRAERRSPSASRSAVPSGSKSGEGGGSKRGGPLGGVTKGLMGVASKAVESAAGTAEGLTKRTRTAGSQVSSSAKSLVDRTQDGAKSFVDKAQGSVQNLTDRVQSSARSVASSLRAGAGGSVTGSAVGPSEARTAEEAAVEPTATAPPAIPERLFSIDTVSRALVAAWVASALLAHFFLRYAVAGGVAGQPRRWWIPRSSALGVVGGVALGVGLGLLLGAGYSWNRSSKQSRSRRLATVAGAKGAAELVGSVPTWLSFRETERVTWLNAILAKTWPFYDAAICTMLREQVEPLMESYKPGFIKRIFFNKLTFGNDPFVVTGVRARGSRAGKSERAILEFDFRWSGDANIVMGIEVPVGGSFTRMAPRVSNLAVSGTAQIILTPLMGAIPPFAAALVSFRSPPTVRFNLDFGKAAGGAFGGSAIRVWLDDFIRNTVSAQMLWPARMVIPLVAMDDPVASSEFYLHHRGAVCIDVISGRELRKRAGNDTEAATGQCVVSVFTTAKVKTKTGAKAGTPGPSWNERLWVLAQEPDTQSLFVSVSEEEKSSSAVAGALLKLGGAVVGKDRSSKIGRASLPLTPFVDDPGRPHAVTLPLGPREFQDQRGCGDERGELHLQVTYWPFDLMKGHRTATVGAVIITLFKCSDLVPMDRPIYSSDPKVVFKVNKERKASTIVWKSLEPKWYGEHFDFFNVPAGSTLELTVFDHDQWSADEVLGSLEIDLQDEVASAPKGDITKTWELEDVPTDWMKVGERRKYNSTITLRIQWIPYRVLGKKKEKGDGPSSRSAA